MALLKRRIKEIFIKTNTLHLFDKLMYSYANIKYAIKNRNFQKQNNNFPFPSKYFLYETYRLDYEQYKLDGEATAREILDWTTKYIKEPLHILEWGCGVARLVRHLPTLLPKDATIFGTDINAEMIKWNTQHITQVNFSVISYDPPTHFTTSQFNLVYALSVFTHIEVSNQVAWLLEIHRLMSVGGVFLFTTHGNNFNINLNQKEQLELKTEGALTIDFSQKGHRMMSSYNQYQSFKKTIEPYFEVLEYYDGADYANKIGGQDLWIVRKIKE